MTAEQLIKLYAGDRTAAYPMAEYVNVASMLLRAPAAVVQAIVRPTCARCLTPIETAIRYERIGDSTYHSSCAIIVRARRTKLDTPAAQPAIGTICGVALPFGEYCAIHNARDDRFEYFNHGAFDASIARGGQTLQVDHFGVPVPGRLTLYTGPDLRFRLQVHNTPFGRGVLDKAARGVFSGASVRFKPRDERPGKYGSTVVHDADLIEISLCEKNGPAWCGTAVWVEL